MSKSWRYTPLRFDILNLRVEKRTIEGAMEIAPFFFLQTWARGAGEGDVESE